MSARTARRVENAVIGVSIALLPISAFIGLCVGNDWIPFSP